MKYLVLTILAVTVFGLFYGLVYDILFTLFGTSSHVIPAALTVMIISMICASAILQHSVERTRA